MFYKQQMKQIMHTLCAKEIIQSNQISPSISEDRACLPDQSLASAAPRTRAPLALQAHATLAPPRQSRCRPCASTPEPTESLMPVEPCTRTEPCAPTVQARAALRLHATACVALAPQALQARATLPLHARARAAVSRVRFASISKG
jgi:hypothetical protein